MTLVSLFARCWSLEAILVCFEMCNRTEVQSETCAHARGIAQTEEILTATVLCLYFIVYFICPLARACP